MRLKTSHIILPFLIASLLFYSCKKAKLNKETTTTEDNSTSEDVWTTVFTTIDVEVTNQEDLSFKTGKTNKNNAACPTIDVIYNNDSMYLKTITIDYGTAGCTGVDGRLRKGIINITQTGRYRIPGTKTTATLVDFYIDEFKVEGSKSINFESAGIFTIHVSNSKITDGNGLVTQWESVRTFEKIAGSNTPLIFCDDIWEITGNANGVNRDGRSYTVDIITPLQKDVCCKWIAKGVIEITPEDLKTRRIDFGDGSCDASAILTIGKKTHDITLR